MFYYYPLYSLPVLSKDVLKQLLNAKITLTPENLPDVVPTREERLKMALEHARVHAKLKGEDHFVELRKHMGWYLGHFPGAKRVRNELVRINSLADVEQIILAALECPEEFSDEEPDILAERMPDPELDTTCAV